MAPKHCIWLGLAAVLGLGGAAAWVWPNAPATVFYSGCSKIWSHRALSDGPDENTVEGMLRAFSLGAEGVEIDVFYDESTKGFFVISEEMMHATGRGDLRLETLLASVPQSKFIWIDFWNLRQIPLHSAAEVNEALKDIIIHSDIERRAIVESSSPERLAHAARLGLSTSLWISVSSPRAGVLRYFMDIARAMRNFNTARFSAVSMESSDYSWGVRYAFYRVPAHLFTVNDLSDLLTISRHPKVRVILSDVPAYRLDDFALGEKARCGQ